MANSALALNALQKPRKGTRQRQKARGKRREGVVKKSVRAKCVERDGYCAIGWRAILRGYPAVGPGHCSGPSEWAHIGPHRRCHTRGQAPEARHTTQGSAMLCKRHHDAYDAHAFDIEPLDVEAGMDGSFRVVVP